MAAKAQRGLEIRAPFQRIGATHAAGFATLLAVVGFLAFGAVTHEARATGPYLQLPWNLRTSFNINGGYSYNCGDHSGPDKYAIDFALPSGTPVAAAAAGTAYTVPLGSSGGYGNLVWIAQDGGGKYVSLYAHLQSFAVANGTWVEQGQLIGYSDDTGHSFGAHLHFALHSGATTYYDGVAAKPEPMSGYTGFGQWGYCGSNPSPYFSSMPEPLTDYSLAGDFNADGRGDIAVLYNYGNAHSALWMFLGQAGGGFQAPTKWWDSGAGGFDWDRSKPVSVDVNNDGKTDVAILYDYSTASCASRSAWLVLTSNRASFSSPSNWWDSGCGNFDWTRAKVSSGWFSGGRSYPYVSALYDYGCARSSWLAWQSTGSSFGGLQHWWDAANCNDFDWSRSRVVSGNFNGDGWTDVAVLYDYSGTGCPAKSSWLVFTSAATSFNAFGHWWDAANCGDFDWNRSLVTSGNFDGDSPGSSDAGVLYDYSGPGCADRSSWLIFTSAAGHLNAPAHWYDSACGGFAWSRSQVAAGSLTGDLAHDAAVLYDYSGGCSSDTGWLEFTSSGANFPNGWSQWWRSGCNSWSWVASAPI